MNPELPQVRPSVEAAPQIPGGAEYFPDGTVRTPERAPVYERQPSPVEQQPAVAPPATIPVPPILAQVPTTDDGVTSQVASDAPSVAGDDDLIEKEWVDKLKSIIDLTRGNPHEQAKAVAALQADYLKKRYNRVVGEADNQGLM